MKRRWPFIKAEVDAIVGQSKFVTGIPKSRRIDKYWVIEAPVYSTADKHQPIPSLVVTARVIKAVPGIPRGLPSVALLWKGHRIRGIDRNTRHDNPDGSHVEGWHEHQWSEEHGDSQVIAVHEPQDKDLRGLFKSGLRRWKISVRDEQQELG